MGISITAQRTALSAQKVKELEELFSSAGIEFFRTGANLNTITFLAGEVDGKEVYASVKFTLHKADFNLEEEIEEYEMLLEEREKKAEEKRRRDAKALKDREARATKAEAKRAAEEKSKEKRRAALSKNKEEA